MLIKINGKKEALETPKNLLKLVSDKGLTPEHIVIEHNLRIVPRSEWEGIMVKENDNVEIVSFMGGGISLEDILEIGGKQIKNRLFIGTGKFSSYPIMKSALEESGAEVVTVALRRVDSGPKAQNILDYIPKGCIVMPNTSGARTTDEAVRIARLARESGSGDWVKIEVIQDNKYLLPDNMETIKATGILVKEGFKVFPYMNPDLSAARRLVDAGAAAVMPLGSPIGSNRGVRTRELIEIMVREIKIPIIVDAGLGKPSSACECMEMGCAAVLVNTAIAIAEDPVGMAKAFSIAVKAGRLAYYSGVVPASAHASASSPLTGFLRDE